ncbi:MAG: hypothetical protein CVV64_12125 [Candidatus Wallbacteria bacterium HGW-Wallbacteria-1]|uniref:Response regulatory domain-containing protein n=1 Tax=Candidatus Wallbacteria bacterium HGW-Wallbacteria-1 TaxID=2013854 RepID=A0A2N1PNG7_9BACT|nr:MAG: hypothetical protein CVV64_12125 [Candidatus Wallbacteria bacterium HGW-Wallbacteria-1]
MRMRSCVFVIEQDDTIRRFICEALSFVGIFCKPFPSCGGVLDAIMDNRVSMLILDVDYPNLEAFELLYELKLKDPYLPVLATSSKTSSLEHLNISHTLNKPFNRMELIGNVFDMLSKMRTQQSRHMVMAP